MTGILSQIIMKSPLQEARSSKFKYIALGVLASAVLLANQAPAAPVQNAEPQQVEQVHRACESIMGLTPDTIEYDECVGSLLQSVAGADEVAALQKDRAACAQEGLRPETADFGLCIVDRAVANRH
jgi:hypothetical protein